MVTIAGGSKKKLSTEESLNIVSGTWINDEYSESPKYFKFIIQRFVDEFETVIDLKIINFRPWLQYNRKYQQKA